MDKINLKYPASKIDELLTKIDTQDFNNYLLKTGGALNGRYYLGLNGEICNRLGGRILGHDGINTTIIGNGGDALHLQAANLNNVRISNGLSSYKVLTEYDKGLSIVPLGSDGLISSQYLPSFVDDIIEVSNYDELQNTNGEAGKIYVTLDTNITYRWSGTQFVEISKSLGLGTNENEAYPGNLGAQNARNIENLTSTVGTHSIDISSLKNTVGGHTNLLSSITSTLQSVNQSIINQGTTIGEHTRDIAILQSTKASKTEAQGYATTAESNANAYTDSEVEKLATTAPIAAGKIVKLTFGWTVSTLISFNATQGAAKDLFYYATYGTGTSVRTQYNFLHQSGWLKIYIDESNTGTILYLHNTTQAGTISVNNLIPSTVSIEEVSAVPENASLIGDEKTLATLQDVRTRLGKTEKAADSEKADYTTLLRLQWRDSLTYTPATNGVVYDVVPSSNVGSLPYGDNANGVLTLRTYDSTHHHQLGFTGKGLFWRKIYNEALNTSSAWSQIALTSDLENYLPLTGGTVNGYTTIGGNFKVTGEIIGTSADGLRLAYSRRGTIFHNTSEKLYILFTALDDPYGNFTTQRPFTIDKESGNVGIGTTNPTEKLEVVGNIKASGMLTTGSNAHIGGTVVADGGITSTGDIDASGNNVLGNLSGTIDRVANSGDNASPIHLLGLPTEGNNQPLIDIGVTVEGGVISAASFETSGTATANSFQGNLNGTISMSTAASGTVLHIVGVQQTTSGKSSPFITPITITDDDMAVGGNVVITGTMTATTTYHSSDERLKTFEGDVEVDLEKLKALPKRYFHWTADADGKRQLGTSAQAVEEVFPELVSTDAEGYKSVNYANLSVVALAAVDKLAEQNAELKRRLAKIEKLLNIE